MDWNYAYSLLSSIIGVAAGFQGIYEEYPSDSLRSSITPPGIFYLLTRGALPALVFAGVYYYKGFDQPLLLQALACGTGAEFILRSRFYVKKVRKGDGTFEILWRGPLDLLSWYQDLFLKSIDIYRATARQAFVRKNLPPGKGFEELCSIVTRNMQAYKLQHPRVHNSMADLRDKFDREQQVPGNSNDSGGLDENYRIQLGYCILHEEGERGFTILFSC